MQIIDSSLRGSTTQERILLSIAQRLIAQIPVFTDQNCWVSDDPVPLSHPGGNEFCTVSFGSGTFADEFFAGAGDDTLTEMGSIVVAPTVPMTGQRVRRRSRRIANDPTGQHLSNRKRQILTALLADGWEPADGEKPLLRDMMSPKSCTAPGEVVIGEAKMLQIQLSFSTVFDWDLSGDMNDG